MKASLHTLPVDADASFLYKILECKHFPNPWHVHKEIEIVLIDKSSGTRFVGNAVNNFDDGDLCIIGPNIPHVYKNGKEYYGKHPGLKARSVFVHFKKNFLGENFMNIPEMEGVNHFLSKSPLAYSIHRGSKRFIIKKLLEMKTEPAPKRLVSLLEILIDLSKSNDLTQLLPNDFYSHSSAAVNSQKLNQIFRFISDHYTEKIYIEEIAGKLHMSVPSFSRFFKKNTRKTFSEYLTEVRISHACRLLMEDKYKISEICYESGFDNLSNFYRQFSKITNTSPGLYRKRFLNEAGSMPL